MKSQKFSQKNFIDTLTSKIYDDKNSELIKKTAYCFKGMKNNNKIYLNVPKIDKKVCYEFGDVRFEVEKNDFTIIIEYESEKYNLNNLIKYYLIKQKLMSNKNDVFNINENEEILASLKKENLIDCEKHLLIFFICRKSKNDYDSSKALFFNAIETYKKIGLELNIKIIERVITSPKDFKIDEIRNIIQDFFQKNT